MFRAASFGRKRAREDPQVFQRTGPPQAAVHRPGLVRPDRGLRNIWTKCNGFESSYRGASWPNRPSVWPPTVEGGWPNCDDAPEAVEAGLGEQQCVEAGGVWNPETEECEGVVTCC